MGLTAVQPLAAVQNIGPKNYYRGKGPKKARTPKKEKKYSLFPKSLLTYYNQILT